MKTRQRDRLAGHSLASAGRASGLCNGLSRNKAVSAQKKARPLDVAYLELVTFGMAAAPMPSRRENMNKNNETASCHDAFGACWLWR